MGILHMTNVVSFLNNDCKLVGSVCRMCAFSRVACACREMPNLPLSLLIRASVVTSWLLLRSIADLNHHLKVRIRHHHH
jgi:hypothetical protein